MCDICRMHPCHPSCPNAPERPVFDCCEICGADIYDGDDYYELNGHKYCETCVREGFKTAEVDYFID